MAYVISILIIERITFIRCLSIYLSSYLNLFKNVIILDKNYLDICNKPLRTVPRMYTCYLGHANYLKFLTNILAKKFPPYLITLFQQLKKI